MKQRSLIGILACASALANAYPRSDLPSINFQHNDWELVCDNTRTCRAAGYHAGEDEGNATVLLTRKAGPDQAVKAELQIAEHPDHTPPTQLQMRIDGHALGVVHIDRDTRRGTLSSAQVKALLDAVLKDSHIAWASGGKTWTISTTGANAVLLKMDDFQGRIATPGALVRPGQKPESSVAPALPAPVIHAANVSSAPGLTLNVDAPDTKRLIDELRKSGGDACELLLSDEASPKFSVNRLSGGKLLLSHDCWHGASMVASAYWVINANPPYDPVMVTEVGTHYADGRLESAAPQADCAASSSWVWDGHFPKPAKSRPACAGISH
nr:DUF1176 domain-containing protein [uncultured Massilia sp.]